MEKSKKINFKGRPKEERNVGVGCPVWIFGNKKSANNDLKKKFEIVDEENKDNK